MKTSVRLLLFVPLLVLASGCATQSDFSRARAEELPARLLGRWFVQQYVSKLEAEPLIYEEAEFRADGTLVLTRVFRHPDYHPPRMDRLSDTRTWSVVEGSLVQRYPPDARHRARTTTSPIRLLTRDKLDVTDPTGATITYHRKLKQILLPRVP